MVNKSSRVRNILIDAEYMEFMTIMCEMFDEYHAVHKEHSAVEMAETCAELVRGVNEELGEYAISNL